MSDKGGGGDQRGIPPHSAHSRTSPVPSRASAKSRRPRGATPPVRSHLAIDAGVKDTPARVDPQAAEAAERSPAREDDGAVLGVSLRVASPLTPNQPRNLAVRPLQCSNVTHLSTILQKREGDGLDELGSRARWPHCHQPAALLSSSESPHSQSFSHLLLPLCYRKRAGPFAQRLLQSARCSLAPMRPRLQWALVLKDLQYRAQRWV